MKESVDWIKGALAKKDIVQQFTHYLVSGGEIRAYDGRMMASHPFPYEGEFLVPGAEFEAILDRMPISTPDIKITETGIRISHSRFRGNIQTLPMTEFPALPIADDWQPMPAEVLNAMKDLIPFISDNATKAWAMAVCVKDGRMYATNNVSLAFADLPQLKDMEALIPVWAVRFVLDRRTEDMEWQIHEGYCAFRWPSGAIMRTQLIADEVPKIMKSMADGLTEANIPITDEWRQAYDLITGVAKEKLELFADRMVGTTDRAEVEHEVENAIPEGATSSTWSIRHLNNIIQIATHWQPDLYPKPSPFRGENIKGLIVGRT